MSTTQSHSGSAAQLAVFVSEAVQRRQALRQWYSDVTNWEKGFSGTLSSFEVGSAASSFFDHPLASQWPTQNAGELDAWRQSLQNLVAASETAAASRVALQSALSEFAKAEEKRSQLLVFGLALLILIVGIYFLVKWSDRASVDQAQRILQERRRENHDAEAEFRASKTAVQQAFQQVQRISGSMMAAEFENDAVSWKQVFDSMPICFRDDWSEASWRAHGFAESYRTPFWVAGLAVEEPSFSRTPFVAPYLVPFLGRQQTIGLAGDPADSLALMHALVLQLATMMPYGATFTLLDPSGAGRAFPMQRGLPYVRPMSVDLARDLEAVWDDIQRIVKTHLDAEVRSFEQLPEQTQANERYEFIIAANFPDAYDRRTIETLQKIAKNGPAAGKYLFIQQSADKELPRDLDWNDFGDMEVLNTRQPPAFGLSGTRMQLSRGPESAVQTLILQRLNAAKPPEHNVQWSDLAEGDPANWWRQDAAKIVETPVGSVSRGTYLNLWFGVNRDGRPCAHGILGAMPGSGKSKLYHAFICGLAVRYGPEELNFYLIDGKMGVEFQVYRRLPHARVVALNSAPELSRSVLAELVAEMERRNELFGQLGVVDLPGYRQIGSPEGPRARIVLVIDEYQELFEDDRLNQASAYLLTLAQQGRSVGIHLMLGSQRFGAPGMLNQAAVFGSIHLRMAMRMSQSDIQGLTEFGRNGKRLIEQCDSPGKIVINANSGDDNSNEFGKVALLEDERRTVILDSLERKAEAEWAPEARFATVVFDGREQPNFVENAQLVDVIRLAERPTEEAWRTIATRPIHEQGFGVSDWYGGERPMALWLGQELNIHGQARVVLRRRAMENILLVGENLNAIYGLLAGLLCSVAVHEELGAVRVFLGDRTNPGMPWDGLLEMVGRRIFDELGYSTKRAREPRAISGWLDEWNAEMDRRRQLEETELAAQPTWLLVLAGVDRLPLLNRVMGAYGSAANSPDGEKLMTLYSSGPQMGLHVLLSFPSCSALKQCVDRVQHECFKHRVVTQVAEADSFFLLGHDQASKLQKGGARPVFAIYQDHTAGVFTKFKPYVVKPQIAWVDQLQVLTNHLKAWKEPAYVNG